MTLTRRSFTCPIAFFKYVFLSGTARETRQRVWASLVRSVLFSFVDYRDNPD